MFFTLAGRCSRGGWASNNLFQPKIFFPRSVLRTAGDNPSSTNIKYPSGFKTRTHSMSVPGMSENVLIPPEWGQNQKFHLQMAMYAPESA